MFFCVTMSKICNTAITSCNTTLTSRYSIYYVNNTITLLCILHSLRDIVV